MEQERASGVDGEHIARVFQKKLDKAGSPKAPVSQETSHYPGGSETSPRASCASSVAASISHHRSARKHPPALGRGCGRHGNFSPAPQVAVSLPGLGVHGRPFFPSSYRNRGRRGR